jgi:hypothetical protein
MTPEQLDHARRLMNEWLGEDSGTMKGLLS